MANETMDTRVVQMEFDNKQFEKNIKQTSKSLDNLKQSLDFKGVGDSVDEVRVSISALQIAATTFIANIANKITNLGLTFLKSLSVDNISAGWSKFGEKTTSVATMMAQKIRIAGQEITDLAEKTAVVNEQLELLTWFSDETSYSFTDMVNNVGKFTAAGQDLDTSVKAMEGIATWAALSGQNAQTASRAMYQLAQAMGKGKIQKIDWMSIQNANMDTEEFRETILSTAVAMGELTKEGDKFVTKTGKKFTQAQFADYLSEGWFTSDVLVKGLNKYSAAIDQIYEIAEREGITASEVIEKYGDTLDQFGVKAFKAAQEARTFTDVLNSVKDAVSSKWMTTFENIFGNQQEAVKLWTDLANELYDVFAESGNFRNDILSVWKELDGRDDLFARGGDNQGAFWNIYDAIIALRDLIKSAWDTVFPLSEMESYDDQVTNIGNKFKLITTRIREFTQSLKMSEANASRLSKIFQGIFNALKSGLIIIKSIRYIFDPILEVGKRLISEVLDQITYYGSKIGNLGSKFESIIFRIHDSIEDLLDVLNPVGILSNFFNFIQKIFNFISDYKPITRLIGHITNFVNALKETTNIKNVLSNVLSMIWSAFSLIGKVIKQVLTVVFKLLPVLSKVLSIISKIFGYIIGTISKVIGLISKLIEIVINFVKDSKVLESIRNAVVQLFTSLYNFLNPLLKIIIEAGKVIGKFLKEVLLAIPKVLGIATKAIENSNILQIISNILTGLINIIRDFITTAGQISSNVSGGFSKAIMTLFSGLMTFIKSLTPVLQVLATVLGKVLEIVGTLINKVFTAILNILTGKGVGKMLKALLALALIYGIVKTAYWLFWSIKSTLSPIHTLLESITDICDSIYNSLQSKTFERIANSILKIAIAVALLASIKEDALINALSAIIILAGVIVGIMFALSKMSDAAKIIHRRSRSLTKAMIGVVDQVRENMAATQNLKKITKITIAISIISNALIKAAIAILILSKIPEKDILRSLGVALAILGFIAGTIYFLNKNSSINSTKNVTKTLKSLGGMIILLIGISIAIRILSNQNWGNLLAASGSIILVLGSLLGVVLILKKMSSGGSKVRSGILSMLILCGGILSIAIALRLVASANWQSILAATVGILAVVSALTGIVILLGKFANAKTVGLFALFTLALIPFAKAMILLSMAIAILGALEYGKVWNGVAAIVVFTILMLGVAKLSSLLDSISLTIFSTSLIMFSIAMELMAGAIAILGALEYGKVWNGVAAIVVFTILMLGVAKLSSLLDSISLTIFSTSLIVFSVAMKIMAGAIAILGALEYGKVWNGVAAIVVFTILMLSVTKLFNVLDSILLTKFSASLIMFSIAMELMAGVLATLSVLPSDRVWDGIKAIAAFVALAALSIKLIGILSALKFAVFSNSLMKFAKAMVIMSTSIIALGLLSQEQVDRGRKAIQAFIAVVALAIKLIGILSALKFAVFASSMILFGKAMLIISTIIVILGAMDSSSMWRGIAAIMAFTAGLATISMLLSYTNAGLSLVGLALGMIIFASALLPFISALLVLGDVDLIKLGKGLLILAASMGTLALVAVVLKPTITTILALSAAMLLAGVGITAVGIGLTFLGNGIGILVNAIIPSLELLSKLLTDLSIQIVEGIVAALPRIIEALGTVVDAITQLLPKIFELVMVIIEGILELLDKEGPHIIETVITLLDNLLKTLNDHMGSIADSVFGILKTILSRIASNIEELGQSLVDIIIGLVKTLTKNIGPLTKVLIDFLIEATIALFERIGPLIDVVTDYVFDFIARVTVALTGKLIALAGLITKVVLIVLAAVIRLTIASLGALSKLFITFVSALLLILAYTVIGLGSTLVQVFIVIVKECLKALIEAIFVLSSIFRYIGGIILKTIMNGLIQALYGSFRWLLEAIDFFLGTSLTEKVDNAINSVSDSLKDAALKDVDSISGSLETVKNSIKNAGNNINEVVSMTADMANEAVISGMGAITNTVSDSMDQLGDAMSQFGEEAGSNLYQGMGSSDNINGANKVGQDMGDATAEGFAKSTETHSPSRLFARFGHFLMEGLGLGIQNGASETEAIMAEVIGDSLQLATDILDGQDGDDYTIKVGMDISSVEAQTSKIQDIMSGVNNPNITASGRNAGYNARALERNNRGLETVNNDNSTTVTYNNTFNIESTDPQQSADEIDKVLKEQNTRFKLAHGT